MTLWDKDSCFAKRKAGESEQRLYAVDRPRGALLQQARAGARALTDALTLVADMHVPAEVYERAAREFDPEELAHLLRQITTTNAWNRIAVARKTIGDDQPPARPPHPRVRIPRRGMNNKLSASPRAEADAS